MRKLITAVVLALAGIVYVASVADAQPAVGITKQAPLVGLGNTASPLRWIPCDPGQTWISTSSAGLGAWACGVAGGVSDGDKTDVTVSGGGATWVIDNGVVTFAKMANVATNVILGRTTAGSGVVEALTPTQATAILNAFTTSLKGLVPASGGGTTNFLRADGTWAAPPSSTGDIDGVTTTGPLAGGCTSGTCALTTTMATSRIIGRATAGTGVMEELTGTTVTGMLNLAISGTKGLMPGTTGTATQYLDGTGSWSTPSGSGGDVTDVNVAATSPITSSSSTCSSGACSTTISTSMTTARIIGRTTAGTGVMEQLTGTQTTALLDPFSSTLKGLVPLSGGGTTNFLRADGGWAAPPGTNPISGLTTNTIVKATSSTAVGNSLLTDNTTALSYNAGKLTVAASTGNVTSLGDFAGVNLSASGTVSASNYIQASNQVYAFGGNTTLQNKGISFDYATNGVSGGCINCVGYADGVSQNRDLKIADGKGATVADFIGSTKSLNFAAGARVFVKNNSPSTSVCGTGAVAVGDNTGGHVTLGGTGTITPCDVQWPTAFTSTEPSCTVTTTGATKTATHTIAQSKLTITNGTAGQRYDWICVDHN